MLAFGNALADDITISAVIDRTEIVLGESVELTISLSGPVRSIAKPSLPDLSDFDVYSSGTSSNISIIPGSFSYQTDYSYVLVPRKVGSFVIKPATVKHNGKVYQTKAIKLKVVSSSQTQKSTPPKSSPKRKTSKQPKQTEDFFIEQTVDVANPYVGQQVTLIFRFYQGKNLYEQPSMKWPDFNGFWVEDLPPQKSYNKNINGKSYRVTEIRRALFPTVSGKITIEPTIMTIPPNAFSSFFNSDPFDFFSRRRRTPSRQKTLRTDKVVLNVRALPRAKKPPDFPNAVGTYNFKISIDKDTVEVDQPIALKAVISGSGNIKKLPAIAIPELENFRLYDSGSNENISKKNYQVTGSKSFEWVLIPTAPGEYNLPGLSFSYFDPWSKKYKTISRQPGKVFVKPSSVASLLPGERSVNIIPAARTSLNYIVTELSDTMPVKPLYTYKIIWIVQLIPIIWLAFLAVHINQRKKLEGDIAYARRKLASKAARKALKKAHEGFANPEQFYSLIYNGIVGFISDKLNISAAGLTNIQIIEMLKDSGRCDDIVGEFSDFLNQCDAGRFSPVKPSPQQIREIYDKAERLLSMLDRGMK